MSSVIQNEQSLSAAINNSLKPFHFESTKFGELWNLILKMVIDKIPVEMVTVMEESDKRKISNKMQIVNLCTDTVLTSNAEYMIEQVIERWRKRELSKLISATIPSIKDASAESSYVIANLSKGLIDLEGNSEKSGPQTAAEISIDWEEEKERQIVLKDSAYISTGFKSMNYYASFHPQDLIVCGGRPGSAKTALALNVALQNLNTGKKVSIFSLEMSKNQLADRMISVLGNVPASLLRKPYLLSERQLDNLHKGRAVFEGFGSNLLVDDSPGLTIEKLRSRAINIKRKHGLDLLIVDYLQLVRTETKFESKVNEIAHVSSSLKNLAKELNVPVFALAQVSRSVDSRDNKRPIMNDLHGGGSIEMDSDCVFFLYREKYYNPNSESNKVEIIYAKNRHGEVGTAHLLFQEKTMMFYEALG